MIADLMAPSGGLSTEGVSELTLGSATLLIFAACAAFSLIRGLIRMVFGTLILCVSAYVGYLVWTRVPSADSAPWVSYAIPGAAGVITLVALRFVMNFLTKPFGGGKDAGNRSLVHKLFRMAFSLVPASALWFSGVTALHHAGSVAEIRSFVDSSHDDSPPKRTEFLAEVKEVVDRFLPQGLLQHVDPLSDKARVTLAKLVALGDGPPPPKAIPVMEEPEIRRLILSDPQLRELARQHRYADILRDPRLNQVIDNPDLKRLLAGISL